MGTSAPPPAPGHTGPPPSPRGSHDRAAVPLQSPLQADGGVVLACAPGHRAAQEFLEEQQHVPVELGGTFHVAALPGPLHQHGDGSARGEALTLQVPLTAYHQDGDLTAAVPPGGGGGGEPRGTRTDRNPRDVRLTEGMNLNLDQNRPAR